MKTLVNKSNPSIRITAPEIKEQKLTFGELVYEVNFQDNDGEDCCLLLDKTIWTLVEEPTCKDSLQVEVNFKIKERKWVHDAVDNIFPEDVDFMSEYDFRKIIKDTARHFYELGLNTRKEE